MTTFRVWQTFPRILFVAHPTARSVFSLIFGVLLFSSLSWAMNLRQENKVPQPIHSFQATVIDKAKVKTSGVFASVDGHTYFRCKHGRGYLFIDFSEITHVTFGKATAHEVAATFTLTNGQTIKGTVKSNLFFFLHAPFGKFRIKLKEIEKIDIEKEVENPN